MDSSHTATRSMIHTQLLIDGEDQSGQGERLKVVNPATEEIVADFQGASTKQVDQAVRAARRAFDEDRSWRDPELRRSVLLEFADLLLKRRDELMDLLISEIGTPTNLKPNHIDTPATFIRWFAEQGVRDLTRNLGFNATRTAMSYVAYRPVGVVAAVTAFNYPILIGGTKVGAALAAGCTAVLLSSPQAPLTVLKLGELARAAGIPRGVLNIIAGGVEAGRALTEHPDVDKISFTGSVNVGRQVMQQAAGGLRDVVLELGGKSAAIMLPGVDLERYAFQLHARYARNAGQGCGSPTRILVEESHYQEFCEVSRKAYEKIKVGDPCDPSTILGPVVSSGQRDRIEGMIARALEQGGEIIAGAGGQICRRDGISTRR